MTQIELVKKIVSLAKENPSAEIKFCVENEFADGEFGWTSHEIVRVELCDWIVVGDTIYTDSDAAKDEIFEMFSDTGTADEKASVDAYFNHHVIKAICVYTSAATFTANLT